MRVEDFAYELPAHLIAQRPAPKRSQSRLLCLDGRTGRVADRRFTDLPALLRPGDLLVFNDTRVLKARLFGRKGSGGKVEVLIERVLGPSLALAQLRPARAGRPGTRILFAEGLSALVQGRRPEGFFELEFLGGDPHEAMERLGRVPLPPYIDRPDEPADLLRYQTVYARLPGAIAAPTAGLHFDEAMLEALTGRGIALGFVTLHVGAGSFRPVRAERVEEHRMHSEQVEVGEEVCRQVEAARARGGAVVAVGTSTVRALESAASSGRLKPLVGETDLFIRPGFRFRVVDALLTNFHLPESTLLMLVCAFAGREQVLAAYRHAVRERYRFYSYGDAMLVTPAEGVRE